MKTMTEPHVRTSQTPPALSSKNALFLDFDGTLVDIAPKPDAVIVPDTLVPLVSALRTTFDGALAIISGRDLNDVMHYLAPLVLPGAGTHGMERRRFDGVLDSPDPDVAVESREMADVAAMETAAFAGVMVERKPFSFGLHYRAAPEREPECRAIMKKLIENRRNAWELMQGKLIVEARLKGCTKASAVKTFMTEPPFAGRIPVFIGDDVTDEAGMRAVMELGGFAIKVGMGESIARYRLPDPDAVRHYLASTL